MYYILVLESPAVLPFLQITLIAMLMRRDEGHIVTLVLRMESNRLP